MVLPQGYCSEGKFENRRFSNPEFPQHTLRSWRRVVDFIHAPQTYKPYLKTGEGVWKGEGNIFSPEKLAFEFYIWKEGDANCCPSAGYVTGEYELQKQNTPEGLETWRIVAKSFQRHTVEESGHY